MRELVRNRAAERRPRVRMRRSTVAAAAVVCTMLCSLITRPAYADPAGDIPDTGSRPIASGQLVMPGTAGTGTTPATTTTTVQGPKAAEITQLQIVVAQLGEKRNRASLDVETAQNALTDAQAKLTAAGAKVADLKEKADAAAAEAYKHATQLGPLDSYANDLHQFGLLAPGLGNQPGGQEAARDLLNAQAAESAARQEVQDAQAALQAAQTAYTPVDADFQTQNAALVKLTNDNQALVQQIAAQEDAAESSYSPNLVDNPIVDGMVANPKAIQALNYALSKVNIAWYVWGDEGPDTFDCSGLAYWAYGQVGVRVPRVAADMYHGTHAIRPSKTSPGDQLLPGDLVYFATDMSDWRTIYHMGIYIGGGKMVNAPTSGQKVKIAEVRWSKLFGATRIFEAVPAPGRTATPTTTAPGNGGTTSASPTPSFTVGPSPSRTTTKPPSTPPSDPPSSDPSPTPTKETPSDPPADKPSDPPADKPSDNPSPAASAQASPSTTRSTAPSAVAKPSTSTSSN
ncbi:NlpC/P60 family protein [Dactylosporangium sp. CA-139066]|uniref:C40 family peptidase n=1 Tax=Dactylosporangium sp. CA-139066 TaxID=3239930 RepID=UPI003D8A8917